MIALGHESMTAADKDLLKWLGVFFRKPTPGRFMMRIRMPNGFTSARQIRAIADVSRRMGNSVVDIATRQQIQLRGFTLSSVLEIWEQVRGVDLHSLPTGMDTVRNICACPLAGLALAGLALNDNRDAAGSASFVRQVVALEPDSRHAGEYCFRNVVYRVPAFRQLLP
jgi:sulfite reductase beta subunit-like hemoprotein